MTAAIEQAQNGLVATLSGAARGPRRNGVYAVWLVVRLCDGVLPPRTVTVRNHRRRLVALERRLSSLSLSATLKRALAGALAELREATPLAAVTALQNLVAPCRDTIGRECADILANAAATARQAIEGNR